MTALPFTGAWRPCHSSHGTAQNDELEWVAPDGRRAVLRVVGSTLRVDVEWASGPEQWTQSLDGAESAKALFESYRERLVCAGFGRPSGGGPSALRPHAAQRVARELRGAGDTLLADLIEADLADQVDAIVRTCERIRESSRSSHGLAPIADALSVLGGFVWVYDDDYRGPQGDPDPVWAELESSLRARRPSQIHAQVFNGWEPARDALVRSGAIDALSHLLLTPLRPVPVRAEPPPRLHALSGAALVLEPWLQSGSLSPLESLALDALPGPIRPWLDRLDALPGLRHLALTTDDVEALVRHPIVERLDTLDLSAMNPGPTLAIVHAGRERLQHLSRLYIRGRQVRPAAREELALRPACFLSHDRLEALGHDLMCLGYPGGHR